MATGNIAQRNLSNTSLTSCPWCRPPPPRVRTLTQTIYFQAIRETPRCQAPRKFSLQTSRKAGAVLSNRYRSAHPSPRGNAIHYRRGNTPNKESSITRPGVNHSAATQLGTGPAAHAATHTAAVGLFSRAASRKQNFVEKQLCRHPLPAAGTGGTDRQIVLALIHKYISRNRAGASRLPACLAPHGSRRAGTSPGRLVAS